MAGKQGDAPTSSERMTSGVVSDSFSTGGSFWNSLVTPLKHLWDPPPIQLSTFYGEFNQPGRPGPVLSVMVERCSAGSTRAKQKARRQTASGKDISQSKALPSFKGLHFDLPHLSRSNSVGGAETVAPEIEGVLLVTPRAIEKYRLNGAAVKRAALPRPVTSFLSAKVAGIGRVFICGSQTGHVLILKTDLLHTLLEFDTGCLRGQFLNAFRKTQGYQEPPISPKISQFSYARQPSPIQSVFADPPKLLPESLLSGSTTAAQNESGSLRKAGTLTGDGITPAFLEGQAQRSSRADQLEEGALRRAFTHLGLQDSKQTDEGSGSLLSVLEGELKPSRSEICSLAVKRPFGDFAESMLAGTGDGEVFVWGVPSGRLQCVLEYPGDTSQDGDARCVTAIEVHQRASRWLAWVSYGNGMIAVFDMETSRLIKSWRPSVDASIMAMQQAPTLGVMITLSSRMELAIWSVADFECVECMSSGDLTTGAPVSSMRIVEPEKKRSNSSSAIIFLGCTDGTICVHRLAWRARNYASTSENPSGGDSSGLILERALIRVFAKEAEPRCPVTSLWIEPQLDTLFVGDASGVVATVLPIRYLLEEGSSSSLTTKLSPPAATFVKSDTCFSKVPKAPRSDSGDAARSPGPVL